MRSFILLSLFIGVPSAWAAKCPNVAGKFTMDTAYGHDTIEITQESCKSLTFRQFVAIDEKKTKKTYHSYIFDGQWRPDRTFDDQAAVNSRARATATGLEITQRRSKGEPKEEIIVLSLDSDRNLVIQKNDPEVWQRSRKR